MNALVLKQFLREEERAAILDLVRGKLSSDDVAQQTAGVFGNLQRIKHRMLLPGTTYEGEEVARLASAAIARNFAFQAATYPKAYSRPRLCCYGPGMDYRDHLDVPLIGKTQLRTDISVTICVSGADSYEGGDLVIDSDRFERRWRGDAGDCIVYASDSIHRVDPVIRGERIVIIFWIESQIRDQAKRKILFDLASGFDPRDSTSAENTRAASMRRCHTRLLKMWAGR
jgi:PKHD-type hydroxylase